MSRVLLATTNPAKVRALAERIGSGISLASLPGSVDLPDIPDEDEQGGAFADIARAKAIRYSEHIADTVIVATDGGLLVPALGSNWNPLSTARSAGPTASDTDRVGALLELARDLTGAERVITWTESLAVARSGSVLVSWTATGPPGELATTVSRDPEQSRGFWVPAVWRCPEFGGRLLADLTDEERLSRRDHWAILADLLTGWFRRKT